MASLDRRRFLSGSAVAGLGAFAACRTEFDAGLRQLDAAAGPERLRREYTLVDGVAYLNHGSIGTIPRLVQAARTAYLATCEQNPWLYMWGGAWDEARERTRAAAARVLGAEPDQVALTHNTTEGFNVLARGLPLEAGDEVLFSSLNHAGASLCFHHASKERGYAVRQFDVPLADVPDLTVADVVALHVDAISDQTRVLVLPHIDNMIGLRHPLAEITAAAKAKGVEFVFVDVAQSLGMIPVAFAASGVDGMCASPHKWLQAPKGLGLFCVTPAVRQRLQPFWVTWGQSRWAGSARVFEDYGTRNLPEVLALCDAIEFRERLGIASGEARLHERRDAALARVDSESGLLWRSPRDWRLSGSLFAMEVAGQSAARLGERLWQQHQVVVRAFGDPLNTLRISPNLANTDDDMDRLFAAIT